jgi:hypothetical protein
VDKAAAIASRGMTLRINSRAPIADHPLDAYMSPPEAVLALMKIERLPLSLCDPCCGDGSLLETLRRGNHIVHGADIQFYRWPHSQIRNYLAEPVHMGDVGTNLLGAQLSMPQSTPSPMPRAVQWGVVGCVVAAIGALAWAFPVPKI